MKVQVVTFNLDGLTDEDFRRACEEQWAAIVAAMPGLVSKSWLANSATNTYCGVYVWENPAALEQYAETAFFRQFAADHRIANLHAEVFDVIEEPSRLTNGLGVVLV